MLGYLVKLFMARNDNANSYSTGNDSGFAFLAKASYYIIPELDIFAKAGIGFIGVSSMDSDSSQDQNILPEKVMGIFGLGYDWNFTKFWSLSVDLYQSVGGANWSNTHQNNTPVPNKPPNFFAALVSMKYSFGIYIIFEKNRCALSRIGFLTACFLADRTINCCPLTKPDFLQYCLASPTIFFCATIDIQCLLKIPRRTIAAHKIF